MSYVIQRAAGGLFLARPGNEHWYTSDLMQAQVYATREEAEANCVPKTDAVRSMGDLVSGRHLGRVTAPGEILTHYLAALLRVREAEQEEQRLREALLTIDRELREAREELDRCSQDLRDGVRRDTNPFGEEGEDDD